MLPAHVVIHSLSNFHFPNKRFVALTPRLPTDWITAITVLIGLETRLAAVAVVAAVVHEGVLWTAPRLSQPAYAKGLTRDLVSTFLIRAPILSLFLFRSDHRPRERDGEL